MGVDPKIRSRSPHRRQAACLWCVSKQPGQATFWANVWRPGGDLAPTSSYYIYLFAGNPPYLAHSHTAADT